jgi:hypothetical protein
MKLAESWFEKLKLACKMRHRPAGNLPRFLQQERGKKIKQALQKGFQAAHCAAARGYLRGTQAVLQFPMDGSFRTGPERADENDFAQ